MLPGLVRICIRKKRVLYQKVFLLSLMEHCRRRILLLIVLMLCIPWKAESLLLTSYLPVSMQALAYYIDLLQYEPLSTTTIEPPFDITFGTEQHNRINATNTTTTTRPLVSSTSSWWQPPVWWQQSTTTQKPVMASPTLPHKPAIYAPWPYLQSKKMQEGYAVFDDIGANPEGFDTLPLSLIRDIQTETDHDDFTNDVESLDNFLRLYDDNYGRAAFDMETAMDRWSTTSIAGKKRVPPTKPYVEFLLVYDLLKRDAKAANLSKYEGYTEELLNDLNDLSDASAQRQLYTIFKRMLDRGDIQRSDVVSRIQAIIKDLGDPNSATSKALQHIPPLVFLP